MRVGTSRQIAVVVAAVMTLSVAAPSAHAKYQDRSPDSSSGPSSTSIAALGLAVAALGVALWYFVAHRDSGSPSSTQAEDSTVKNDALAINDHAPLTISPYVDAISADEEGQDQTFFAGVHLAF